MGGNSLCFFLFKKGCSTRSCLSVGGGFVSQGPHVLWGQWKDDCGFGHWLGTLSIHSWGLNRLEGHRIIVSILIRFSLVWVSTFFSMKTTSFHTQTFFFKGRKLQMTILYHHRGQALPFFLLKKTAVSQAEGWDAFRTAWISVLSCPQPTKIQKGWQGIWMARKIRSKNHCRLFGGCFEKMDASTSLVQHPKQVKSLPSWCLSQRVKGLSIYANWNESNVDKDWLESHTRKNHKWCSFWIVLFFGRRNPVFVEISEWHNFDLFGLRW